MLDARCLSAFLLPLSFEAYDYTRLGMRLRKNDPTGNYWYDADGVSPASPVLSDGYSTFTPGISEINGGGSRFYLADAQGNSRGLLDGGQGNTDGYNWDAFGNSVSRSGANPTAYAWNEGAGYQSDADSGLKLLGHRYYDSRTGRFISRDPAGDGDNWYGYCGNDPMGKTDPSGLWCPQPNMLSASGGNQSDLFSITSLSAERAFAGMGLAVSAGLVSRFNYYNLDKITYDTVTKNIISIVHIGEFAVPSSVGLMLDYHTALSDRSPGAAFGWGTYSYFKGKKNGIAQNTRGDFKNAKIYPMPPGITLRQRNQLTKLLDHGGNFHGGMIADGFGTRYGENWLIGSVAKSLSSHDIEWDDTTGQTFFSAGWQYANNMDPN